MKKTVFAKNEGISANILAELSHNDMVSMDAIVRICRNLNCVVDDIMDILPETVKKIGGGVHVSKINGAPQF